MKSAIYELIQNDSIRNEIKQIFKPFGEIIYNELFFYILLILVYCGLLFMAILGTLFYLIRVHKKLSKLDIIFGNNI
jgi:hypothetical protein